MRNRILIILTLVLGACNTDLPTANQVGNTTNSEWYAEFLIDGKSINLYSNPSSFYSGKPYSPYGFMRVTKTTSSVFQLVVNDSLLNPLFQIDLQLKDTAIRSYLMDTTEFKQGFGNRLTIADVVDKSMYDAFGPLYKEYGFASGSPLHPVIEVKIDAYEGLPVRDGNGYYQKIGSVSGTISGTIVKKSTSSYSLVPITGKFKLPIY